mmetsp:Transcript_73585/g.170662  ORF Transcript_73585/g.170662 Transcript_73585/m.170662 type:complete len:208 (+) Transcript_73585:460-1083(+)
MMCSRPATSSSSLAWTMYISLAISALRSSRFALATVDCVSDSFRMSWGAVLCLLLMLALVGSWDGLWPCSFNCSAFLRSLMNASSTSWAIIVSGMDSCKSWPTFPSGRAPPDPIMLPKSATDIEDSNSISFFLADARWSTGINFLHLLIDLTLSCGGLPSSVAEAVPTSCADMSPKERPREMPREMPRERPRERCCFRCSSTRVVLA